MYPTKIINDPIYGFIKINNPLILELINHPYFQRLKRIKQLGFSNPEYVYNAVMKGDPQKREFILQSFLNS